MREISIVIILIYQKFGSVGPVKQNIKLPLPYAETILIKFHISL